MTLPRWAQRAIDTFAPTAAWGATEPDAEALQQHELLAAKMHTAWPSLRPRVVRELEPLAEDERQRVLEDVLHVLKYRGTNEWFADQREAHRNVARLTTAIEAKADELAQLFRRRSDLCDRHDLVEPGPDLPDCLESWLDNAKKAVEFSAWACTAGHNLARFLVVARSQSRPGPGLAEFVDVIARGAPPALESTPPASRKRTSDLRRALIEAVDSPRTTRSNFSFSHEAIADLACTLFDDEVTGDDIRHLRRSKSID